MPIHGWPWVRPQDYGEDYDVEDLTERIKDAVDEQNDAPEEGWMCPRCKVINAPFKERCDCCE